MLENAAPPLWKSSSPMTNSSMESIPHITPLLNPSSQPKNPPENFCTVPNNHYYMQTLVKFCKILFFLDRALCIERAVVETHKRANLNENQKG